MELPLSFRISTENSKIIKQAGLLCLKHTYFLNSVLNVCFLLLFSVIVVYFAFSQNTSIEAYGIFPRCVVGLERIFSSMIFVNSDLRNRLGPQKVSKLAYCVPVLNEKH